MGRYVVDNGQIALRSLVREERMGFHHTAVRLAGKTEFIQAMMKSYRASEFTPSHRDTLEDLRVRMLDIAVRCVNKGKIDFFGSLVTGFSKPGCDADMSLTFRNFSPWLRGITTVEEKDQRKLNRFSREASNIGMEGVRYVRARVPVVQFTDPVSSTRCDVSIGNVGGVSNSKILRSIRDINPDFYGAYINMVKEWGKRREVIAPDRSAFNSFTLTVMALMTLQELGLAPIFSQPTGQFGELTEEDAAKEIDRFALPDIYRSLAGDDMKLGEAVLFCFQRFATYYHRFDFTQGTVSLMAPRRHRQQYKKIVLKHLERFRQHKRAAWESYHEEHKEEGDGVFSEEDFKEAMFHEEVQRVWDTPFVVEDFVNYVNCGRRVTPAVAVHIRDEFARLDSLLSNETTLSMEQVMEHSCTLNRTHMPEDLDPRVTLFHREQ